MTHGVCVVLLTALALAEADGRPTSASSAEQLTKILASSHSDAIATEAADEPGRFIAALLLPEQLLVVTARCNDEEYLRAELKRGAFRELYTNLHACAIPSTKLFVQDIGSDGLRSRQESSPAPDIVYEKVARLIVLDGDWRKQKLDEAGYLSLCAKLDAQYDRLLQALIAALGS